MRWHKPNDRSHSSQQLKTVEHSEDVWPSGSGNGYLKIPVSIIRASLKRQERLRRTLTLRTDRTMAPLAKDAPRTSAGGLQRLVESWGQKVSKTTIRCHLDPLKLCGRVVRKKPLLSINTKLKRLQFAKRCCDFQCYLVRLEINMKGGFGV